jgi:signal transduction histidine kinase
LSAVAAYQVDRLVVGEIHDSRAMDSVAQIDESHLVRELHDGVAQDLATMLLDLEHFRGHQAGRLSVLNQINQLQDQLRMTLTNIRSLIYDQRDLHSADFDFTGNIRKGIIKRFGERTGIDIKLSVSRNWPRVISAPSAYNLHRIVQEALNNISRHSGATRARIRFEVDLLAGIGVITVRDNGRGFPGPDEGWRSGLGLLGIGERAVLLGASARVENPRSGGSALIVSLPLRSLVMSG